MKERKFPNLRLIALIVSCFIQIGAQLFAIVVIARTVIAAPPRSFGIFEGEYGLRQQYLLANRSSYHISVFLLALVPIGKPSVGSCY